MAESPYKRFFHTLSNKTRLEIIHVLRNKPMNATKLTEKLSYKQKTICHNLKRHCFIYWDYFIFKSFGTIKKVGKIKITNPQNNGIAFTKFVV